jgi:hypothetical protein
MKQSTRRRTVLFLGMCQLSACASWRPASPGNPAEVIEREAPSRIRLTRRGGQQVELANPTVRADSIVDGPAAVSISDVVEVETRHFSAGRTLLLITTPILIAVGLVIVGYANYDHTQG